MAYQYKLQIPISEELNKQLKKKVQELGFSSVSEATRFLLTNLINGNLSIGFSGRPSNKELENILSEALEEYNSKETLKLDFDKPLHEQIVNEL